MVKAQHHQVENRAIAGCEVTITSYQIDGRFYCHIDNKDPGATIARTDGPTREEAVRLALEKARTRLQNSRSD